jgi:hypothetical protein
MPKNELAANASSNAMVFDDRDNQVAKMLNVVLSGNAGERTARAVHNHNMAARLAVEAGYLLLSAKSDCEHGDFAALVESYGLSRQRASELINMAKFASRVPDEQLTEMLSMPKTKVMALAQADAEVVADLLESNEVSDLNNLSIRQLKSTIAELKSDRANALAARDKAEADATYAAEQLQTALHRKPSKGEKPYLVLDLTADHAVYVRKIEIALQALQQQVETVRDGYVGMAGYHDSMKTLVFAGIAKVALQAAQLVTDAQASGIGDQDYARLDLQALFDDQQLAAANDAYAALARIEEAETHNRKVDRAASRPKGKGAPLKAMPIAADDAALADGDAE